MATFPRAVRRIVFLTTAETSLDRVFWVIDPGFDRMDETLQVTNFFALRRWEFVW